MKTGRNENSMNLVENERAFLINGQSVGEGLWPGLMTLTCWLYQIAPIFSKPVLLSYP